MEQNRFGNLLVQELFQKGYFTSVYKAYDEGQNKGVLLQIITPIFSSNKRYNFLLAEYAKRTVYPITSSILPVSSVITDSDRIGLVYELPSGLSQDWNNFTSPESQSSPQIIETCQNALASAFTYLMQNNVLHRALRPESLVFNETNNQAFLTLCAHFEALFYLETEQNPAFQGQFQANFYKAARLSSFEHYDVNDEYYGFAKTWYFLDLVKNGSSSKTIDSNLQALTIPEGGPLTTQLNVLLNGDLQAKHQTFAESFQVKIPHAPIEEIVTEQAPSSETTEEELPPVIEKKPKIVLPPFEQPPIINKPNEVSEQDEKEKEHVVGSQFSWKKYAAIAGGLVVLILAFVYIYSNLMSANVEQAKEQVTLSKEKDEPVKEEVEKPKVENDSKTLNPDKPVKSEDPKKENKPEPSKVTVTNAPSALSILDNTYGIYQLDELSKLIDRSGTLSAKDRALLVAKASAIYANLPKLVGQLTSSDQRKLCNYSGEFANYLKRNGATANPSIQQFLNPYCN
jgi:hypothetical protein